jgi:putative nucleotidyltransferase with HDIG domain
MKGLGKILLVEENETRRKNIARFFSGEALPIQESLSFPDGANRLLNSNDFTIALLNALFFETHEKNFLQKIRTSNPQLSIILMTSEENSKPALFLLKQKLVDQITSADNLASLFSAVNSEIQKTEVIRKSEFLQSRFDKLHKEQKKNIQRTLELEEIYDSTLENLMTALDLRDVETFGHSRTVAKYSQLLARTLNIKDRETLDNIRKGALLHDVGKIAIPDVILKKPTPLTPEEWKKIRLHPSLGYGLIKEIKLLNEVGNIILYHHEKYDGSGYPKGLKNDEIPLEARREGFPNSQERNPGKLRKTIRSQGCGRLLFHRIGHLGKNPFRNHPAIPLFHGSKNILGPALCFGFVWEALSALKLGDNDPGDTG